ncbi:MAG: hypothetical protein DBX67_07850 [Desulfovibrionaceae bacterium]|nr:MAG: hypothetical protein DBX67_07850 [Desulfovibrionaceae bacterium]
MSASRRGVVPMKSLLRSIRSKGGVVPAMYDIQTTIAPLSGQDRGEWPSSFRPGKRQASTAAGEARPGVRPEHFRLEHALPTAEQAVAAKA